MARLNIAMLAQEESVAKSNGDELLVDGNVVEVHRASGEIEQIEGVVDETRTAADAVDGLANKIDSQQNISEDAVQVAQEMMSYFGKRTGVGLTGVHAAMESYSYNQAAKKERIVKELRLANESLRKHICVAQEGIIDRIKNKFSLLFSNADKLEKELKQVSADYDKNGPKDQVIEDAAFARIFAIKGKSVVSGSDVIAFADNINKGIHNPEIVKIIKDITRLMEKLTLSLSKGDFFADSKSFNEILELHREILELNAQVQDNFDFSIQKDKVDIAPLDKNAKDKLVPIILSLLDTKEFEKAEEELDRAVNGYYSAYFNAVGNRLFGEHSKDARDADSVSGVGEEVYSKLSMFVMDGFEVAHSCVKYIKASTRK